MNFRFAGVPSSAIVYVTLRATSRDQGSISDYAAFPASLCSSSLVRFDRIRVYYTSPVDEELGYSASENTIYHHSSGYRGPSGRTESAPHVGQPFGLAK
jgi:hypothetical protein